MTTSNDEKGAVRAQVREHYAAAARAVTDTDDPAVCCGPATDGSLVAASTIDADYGASLYAAEEQAELPPAALAASLGCGNPIAVADLRPGETVLDLGSGGGIDVILSARRVGETGKAYGLDMTEELLALALRNVADAQVHNVEFLKGDIEAVPLPAQTVDVVISNCVINLSVDKPAVFAEMARVLKPGGRLGISDVVAENRLTAADRAERGSFAGCVAGALSVGEYAELLAAASFADVSVTFTHEVADGMHGAIIRARKPAATEQAPPVVGSTSAATACC